METANTYAEENEEIMVNDSEQTVDDISAAVDLIQDDISIGG